AKPPDEGALVLEYGQAAAGHGAEPRSAGGRLVAAVRPRARCTLRDLLLAC
nr:hypothetical protein [Tanacetum cinerariifolium]